MATAHSRRSANWSRPEARPCCSAARGTRSPSCTTPSIWPTFRTASGATSRRCWSTVGLCGGSSRSSTPRTPPGEPGELPEDYFIGQIVDRLSRHRKRQTRHRGRRAVGVCWCGPKEIVPLSLRRRLAGTGEAGPLGGPLSQLNHRVIPAKAGIQGHRHRCLRLLDSRLRGNDIGDSGPQHKRATLPTRGRETKVRYSTPVS